MLILCGNHQSLTFGYWAGKYPGRIGWLLGPINSKLGVPPWMPYALDNDAYICHCHGRRWDEHKWLSFLDRQRLNPCRPRWALVPDVVCNREKTLERWDKYHGEVIRRGMRPAFAVQDGMTPEDVPAKAEVVFIGGSTSWKMRSIPVYTQKFSCVHVGRINTPKNLASCQAAGVESVDGSGWMRTGVDGTRAKQLEAWLDGKYLTDQTEMSL